MKKKCVIVLKEGLPLGFAANAAAVLSVSLGHFAGDIVAEDLIDASGARHRGLINVPLPVLQATELELVTLYQEARQNPAIELIDFSEPARVAKTFDQYRDSLANTRSEDLSFVGLALFGEKAQIAGLTKRFKTLK